VLVERPAHLAEGIVDPRRPGRFTAVGGRGCRLLQSHHGVLQRFTLHAG
jgi:hypothetical protein